MEVIISKFDSNCTNAFLNTFSLFSVTLNIFGNENGLDTCEENHVLYDISGGFYLHNAIHWL